MTIGGRNVRGMAKYFRVCHGSGKFAIVASLDALFKLFNDLIRPSLAGVHFCQGKSPM